MDLRFTDEQALLRETVRELCVKHSPPEAVRALEDDPVGYREDFWRELAGIGLTGLAVAEEHGGAGASLLDLVVVYEELGRALAQTPHFVSCVLAANALRAGGSTDLLPAIAAGETIVTVAHEDAPDDAVVASDVDGVWTLRGSKMLVPFARAAEMLLVITPDGVFSCDSTAVAVEQQRTMARDASFLVRFDGTPAVRLGDAGAFDEALAIGWVALAAWANGAAARAHEMAVEYAKERIQFDKPIGAFQGVAHPLADMATEVGGSTVLTYQAAWARDSGRASARPLAAMAKMYAADVFKRATKVGQQVYGGIGFTLDIDMQLYFRRAKQLEVTWTGPRALEEIVAAAELDAETPLVGVDVAR